MAIKAEFVHYFRGFRNSHSRCHIRILDEQNKHLVIMFTQISRSSSSSIINSKEIIAQELQDYLGRDNRTLATAIDKYTKNSKLTKILDDLIYRLKDSNNLTVFTLESIKISLEYRERQLELTGRITNFIWVEHYPKAIGFLPEDCYAIMSFALDSWSPQWQHLSLKELLEITGYNSDDFLIDDALIRA